MKTKTLTTGNSLKNNTGFTLIELLVVILIVGILAGFVTLSINLAKPSAVNSLKTKIQQRIAQTQNHVQLYNQPIQLKINQNNIQALSFQSINSQDDGKILKKSFWQPSKILESLSFESVKVKSSVKIIKVLPNGFTTNATLLLSQDGESVTFKVNPDEPK